MKVIFRGGIADGKRMVVKRDVVTINVPFCEVDVDAWSCNPENWDVDADGLPFLKAPPFGSAIYTISDMREGDAVVFA